jgi:hypothetical protein
VTKRAVTLGSDPEIAITDLGGSILPVCGLFGGDKGKPVPAGPEGGWLEDGIALELNPVPASTPNEAHKTLKTLLKAAVKHAKAKKLLVQYPIESHVFDNATIAAHPKASIFGCAQDFSAYHIGEPREGTMEKAMQQVSPNVRFYGGHLHLGVTDWPETLPKFIAVRLMDLLLGVAVRRRYAPYGDTRDAYYGLSGLYRETPYGVEYRTPGNGWMQELSDDGAYTYRRLARVGKLFADFEKYEAPLVELYNDIDWEAFSSAFDTKFWNGISRAVGRRAKRSADGDEKITIGDETFCLYSLNDERRAHAAEAEDILKPSPNKRAKYNINYANYVAQNIADGAIVDEAAPVQAPDAFADLVARMRAGEEAARDNIRIDNAPQPDNGALLVTHYRQQWAESRLRARDSLEEAILDLRQRLDDMTEADANRVRSVGRSRIDQIFTRGDEIIVNLGRRFTWDTLTEERKVASALVTMNNGIRHVIHVRLSTPTDLDW